MSDLSIWPLRKTWLRIWWQSQMSDVSCSWPPGLHTSQEGFCPAILYKSLRFRGWCLATQTFSSLHRLSWRLWSGDWLGLCRTLMCFFLSHSFVALAMCFGSLSCWNTHPLWPIFNALAGFNALALPVHAPFHRPFDAVQLSCPLSKKTPPKQCFHVWWCSWGHRQHSSSSKHGELSWCQRAWLRSNLTTTLSSSSPLNHWQTSDGLYMCILEQGDLAGAAGFSVLLLVSSHFSSYCYHLFSWWLWSQLPWDHWQDNPVQFWADSSSFSWSLKLHEARSCIEPQSEGDLQLFCVSSICEESHQLLSPSHQAAWRGSCYPFQHCVSLQSCPWHPWTALWSWPWWGVWNLIDCFCGQVSFIQVTRWDSL